MRGPSHPAVASVLTDPALPARFWACAELPVDPDPSWPHGPNVDGVDTPCWTWQHTRDTDGYAVYVVRTHQTGAARIALAFGEAHGRPRDTPPAKREWQLGGKVLATCGHRDCVRPSHQRVALSEVGRRVLEQRFGRVTVTAAEIPPPEAPRRRSPRARRTVTPPHVPDIQPAAPLATAAAILPDGRSLVIAVGMQFKSGSFLVYTPWGPFDGATIAEATAAAVAGHPDATGARGIAA